MAMTLSRALAALCTQLAKGRKDAGGGRGKRIPEAVWHQAAAVARAALAHPDHALHVNRRGEAPYIGTLHVKRLL